MERRTELPAPIENRPKPGLNRTILGAGLHEIVRRAIANGVANASLIKPNQIGTVSETVEAVEISKQAIYGTVISHRSGETSDDFISDFAVGSNARQVKTGAPARGERVAKYNQLMRSEEELGSCAKFAGPAPFLLSEGK